MQQTKQAEYRILKGYFLNAYIHTYVNQNKFKYILLNVPQSNRDVFVTFKKIRMFLYSYLKLISFNREEREKKNAQLIKFKI